MATDSLVNGLKDSMRILVVDDELKTTEFLRKGLTENGFEVAVSRQGEEGLQRALTERFDLLVLDVMLPKRDGWSILANLRKSGKETPALFLTARDTIASRVRGLNLGADDYLVKPFAFSELLARVHSILRRADGTKAAIALEKIQVADLEIDLLRHRVSRARHRLELTPREFDLLLLLARCQGEILSRDRIAQEVWDMHFDGGTNVVDVHVRRLRSKLDDPFTKKLIHTVRGVGYVLEGRS
jgi:two-component system copper resistance phosphate regulon response regulator CusR